MTDQQRLLALFDAAYAAKCDLVIWQASEPKAPDVFRAWAAANQAHMETYSGDGLDCLEVKPRHSVGRISVYLERAR